MEINKMKKFKEILCVVDNDDACKTALNRAVTLAENNQANLTVVEITAEISIGSVMPKGGPSSADLKAAVTNINEERLASLIEPYKNKVSIKSKVLTGPSFLEIIREVLRNKHDLVIKSPENSAWLDRLLGSDDMHLLRKCPCPVWLIKPESDKPYQRILAAVDVEENFPEDEREVRQSMNREILQLASSLALSEFAELHVVHAWNAPGESAMRGGFMNTPLEKIDTYGDQVKSQHAQTLDTLMNEITDNLGQETLDFIKPKIHLVKGWARKETPAVAKEISADLVVMGTVARTGIPGFLMGNTAESILNQIDCSVLAVKPSGFVTPVTLVD
jgi:nucleotide-binding universal stress UspA family protein